MTASGSVEEIYKKMESWAGEQVIRQPKAAYHFFSPFLRPPLSRTSTRPAIFPSTFPNHCNTRRLPNTLNFWWVGGRALVH